MTLEGQFNTSLYRRYIHTLCISPATHRHYYSALRRFERFVTTHSVSDALSQATLVAWLQTTRAELPLERTIDYARKLDGFLSWLVEHGQLGLNPYLSQNPPPRRRVKSSRIHHHKLAAQVVTGRIVAITGHPRFIFHDGASTPYNSVKKPRLTHIGSANDGYQRILHAFHPI